MIMEHVPVSDEQQLYSVPQAALKLGITETALRGWVFHGRIHVHRVGRRVLIPKTEIERLAERQ